MKRLDLLSSNVTLEELSGSLIFFVLHSLALSNPQHISETEQNGQTKAVVPMQGTRNALGCGPYPFHLKS